MNRNTGKEVQNVKTNQKNPGKTASRILAVAVAAAVGAGSAFGGFVSREIFLPAVGRIAGQGGAQFYTTIWVTSLSASKTIHFTFQFLKQGQGNASDAPFFTDTLAPGETKIYENLIEAKLHLSNAIGAGRLAADGEIFASERIYDQAHATDNLGTTQGLFFAGVPSSVAIGLGEKASIQGVNQGDPTQDMRTNFALVETTGHPATVHVSLASDLGASLGAVDFPLQPYEQIQPNVAQLFAGVSTINARIVASVTAGTGRVIIAGAQLANTSQDSSGFQMSFPVPPFRIGPSIAVGNYPEALAFDGANVWVTNASDGTVQKISIATGVPGAPIAVAGFSEGIVFDGANIWVSNNHNNTVQKIPIATGVPGLPIAVGRGPATLAFDGVRVWVANEIDGTVQPIPIATGVPGTPIAVGYQIQTIAFGGASIWVASSLDKTVRRVPVDTGVPGPPITVAGFPWALAFDGADIWEADESGTVQRIPVATGVPGAPIPIRASSFLTALAFDGTNMWVAGYDWVCPIPISTGVPGPVTAVGGDPWALAFDGSNMWVAKRYDRTVVEVGPAVPSDVFLPAVGRVSGQGGAEFYTTIWTTNLSERTRHFTFRFLKQGQANDASPASFTDELAPGQTKIYENVVEEKLHLNSAIGAGRITSDGEILVSERIYNQAHASDNLGTTEGLFFAGVPASVAIGPGEKASIQGVNQGNPAENMRYNFALVETTGHAATARVSFVNDLGVALASTDFPLLPYEQLQPNVASVLPAVSTINARLVAEVVAGTGRVIIAGAQLANTSQDSSGFEMSFRDPAIGVGVAPDALTFDGTDVWVSTYSDRTVQRLPVVSTVPSAPIVVGGFPTALAFDGANVWVAMVPEFGDGGTVQKIPIATGVPGAPITVGSDPAALTFDGANIWVANYDDSTVQKIPVATGVPGPPIHVGAGPQALAFDGVNVWVANFDGDSVQKIPVATGIPGAPIGVGDGPAALAFDGANVWVANSGAGTLQKIPASGAPGAAIGVGSNPFALAFDGTNVWVANAGDATVQAVPVATGVPGRAIRVEAYPAALVFDGANIWVANENGNSVQKP
ncbi:MAG: YncE family protein [Thermoanaerobaculia bacterium]